MKMFSEELGNDHGDQVLLMGGEGTLLAAPWFLCSALPAPMPRCRSCTLHFCSTSVLPKSSRSGLCFSPTPPMAASAFPAGSSAFAGWEEALKIFQKSFCG